jgi:hypothetical protein
MRAVHRRSVLDAGMAVAAILVTASCQASATPEVIYVTPEPTPIVIYVTPEPTPIVIYVTPEPTLSVDVTPEPSASAMDVTPEPTAEASSTPSPTPTSPASFCTGSNDNRAFFAEAARGVGVKVYCATGLPSGWVISAGAWSGSKTVGNVNVVYRYKNTSQRFELKEGAFCTTSKVDCMGGPSAPAPWLAGPYFDGRPGEVANLFSSGDWVIEVGAGTTRAYIMTGTNVDVNVLVGFAHNMKAVPKT